MANWKQSEPATNNSTISVYNEDGIEGRTNVYWNNGRVSFSDCVWRITKWYLNADGSQYDAPDREILDLDATYN